MRFYLYILIAALLGAIPGLFIPGYWGGYLLFLLQVVLLWAFLVFVTPPNSRPILVFLSLILYSWVAHQAWTAREPHPATNSTKTSGVLIGPDLVPEAMRACAEAFARYGFWDVRDYECRVERGPKGVVVALYGPGVDGKAGEKKRLGEVPLER
jgi:hypothetical protein